MSILVRPSMARYHESGAGHPRNQTEITSTPSFQMLELRRPDIEYTKRSDKTGNYTRLMQVTCLERAAYEHLAKDGAFLSREIF